MIEFRELEGWAARGLIVAATLGAIAFSGCDEPTVEEQCSQLGEYVESRMAMVQRACESDSDCRVAFVRPDVPSAVSNFAADADLERVLSTQERLGCVDYEPFVGNVVAVCEPTTDPDPDAEELPERQCELRGDVPQIEINIPSIEDRPEPVCVCESDADCDTGSACLCECVELDVCGRACLSADDCETLTDLGLGTDAATCAESCRAYLTDNVGPQSFVSCLADANCGAHAGCLTLLP